MQAFYADKIGEVWGNTVINQTLIGKLFFHRYFIIKINNIHND
jgi:hypothetical protein